MVVVRAVYYEQIGRAEGLPHVRIYTGTMKHNPFAQLRETLGMEPGPTGPTGPTGPPIVRMKWLFR